MAFTNIKPGGYAFGEILPSADMTNVTSDLSNAIDKRSGALEISTQSVTNYQPVLLFNQGNPAPGTSPPLTYGAIATAVAGVAKIDFDEGGLKFHSPFSNIPGNGTLTALTVLVRGDVSVTSGNGPVVTLYTAKEFSAGDSAGSSTTMSNGVTEEAIQITIVSPIGTSGVSPNTSIGITIDGTSYWSGDSASWLAVAYIKTVWSISKVFPV